MWLNSGEGGVPDLEVMGLPVIRCPTSCSTISPHWRPVFVGNRSTWFNFVRIANGEWAAGNQGK
jgi:hypothetical protein